MKCAKHLNGSVAHGHRLWINKPDAPQSSHPPCYSRDIVASGGHVTADATRRAQAAPGSLCFAWGGGGEAAAWLKGLRLCGSEICGFLDAE